MVVTINGKRIEAPDDCEIIVSGEEIRIASRNPAGLPSWQCPQPWQWPQPWYVGSITCGSSSGTLLPPNTTLI